jgi:hypothetical protein
VRLKRVEMRIDKDQIVAGLPARDVRRFMRSVTRKVIHAGSAAQTLGLTKRESEQFLCGLEREGLISTETGYTEYTVKGSAFAMATAARPLHKNTAERLVGEVVERAQIVNLDTRFAYRVEELILFGSVMKGADRPNDVDIGCKLIQRFHGERQRIVEDQCRAKKGAFRNTIEWAYWPKFEILKTLKSRSRGLSIHDMADWNLGDIDHRAIFIDRKRR